MQQFTFVIKHQSSNTNKVADALNRRHSLFATLHVSVFAVFLELYPQDPFFGHIWTKLQSGRHYDFVLQDDFIFSDNRLCVLVCSLCLHIVKEFHGEGHVGRDKMLH